MRISDWSSDVCSSDLITPYRATAAGSALRQIRRAARVRRRTPYGGGVRERGARARATRRASRHRSTPFRQLWPRGRGRSDGRRSFRYKDRSEEHTSELQSLMRISYAVFCLKKKKERGYH